MYNLIQCLGFKYKYTEINLMYNCLSIFLHYMILHQPVWIYQDDKHLLKS